MPTLDELLTIRDAACGLGATCIDPIFGATQASAYWSSTEADTDNAWFVNFFHDDASANTFFENKSFAFHMRAVRGGS